MPAIYAHYQFGRMVYQRLRPELSKIITGNPELYAIGLQGPDLLFYYGSLGSNPVNQTGYRLHEQRADAFFVNALQVLRESHAKAAAHSYLLGMVCHFALDSECHGYIEYKVKQSGISHAEIETEFDRMLIHEDLLSLNQRNLIVHIPVHREQAEIIAEFYDEISSWQIVKALRSMVFYNRLLKLLGGVKGDFIMKMLRLTGQGHTVCGLVMSKFPNPSCQDCCAELHRRFENAVEVAAMLIENLCSANNGKDVLSQRFERTFGPDQTELDQYKESEPKWA